ncbi:hypothetical protein D3C72_823030 [compost metagenome]
MLVAPVVVTVHSFTSVAVLVPYSVFTVLPKSVLPVAFLRTRNALPGAPCSVARFKGEVSKMVSENGKLVVSIDWVASL